MVLLTFVISLDDVLGNATAYPSGGLTVVPALTTAASIIPVTVQRTVNLNSGTYKATIEGFQIVSGSANTTTYLPAPQLINISSPAWVFPGNGLQGVSFTNSGQYTHSDVGGRREFLMNVGQGNILLNLYVAQFGTGAAGSIVAPYTINTAATWSTAQFAYVIISINVRNQDDTKSLFGNAGQ